MEILLNFFYYYWFFLSLKLDAHAIKLHGIPASTTKPSEAEQSRLKSITSASVAEAKPSSSTQSALPNTREATLTKTTIKTSLVNIKQPSDNMEESNNKTANEQHKDETLPEGFFDDAKARSSENEDPVEEEWERFQQEIEAESDYYNATIAEYQEEELIERQNDEMDE